MDKDKGVIPCIHNIIMIMPKMNMLKYSNDLISLIIEFPFLLKILKASRITRRFQHNLDKLKLL